MARIKSRSTGSSSDLHRQKPEVVVVTGASAGLGRAIARRFARCGASVGLLARGPDGLAAAKTEMEELGGSGLSIPTDVADPQQVEDAAAKVEREFGPIDIWVNNAMTTIFAPLCEITPSEFKRATEVTYLGTVYGTMAALRRMLPRNRGSIVQVGSALAYRSIPLQAAYCGAKHAIRGFTDSVRSELLHGHSDVHLTMVQMPALNTPQFSWCRTRLPRHPQPVPPIYQPEVAAEAVVWAAHNRRRELFVGESTEKAIWANKIAPGYLDSYLARHGYEDQQAPQPVDPNRPDNLFHPIAGDAGAHGIFDRRAKNSSIQLWAATHRGTLAAAAGLLASLAFVGVLGNRH